MFSRASVLCAFLLIVCGYAQANEPLPLEAQEDIGRAQNAMEELNNLEMLADRAAREKTERCIRSFGDAEFCKCISSNTALILPFDGYINVTSQDKDEIGYEKLTPTNKKIVDSARAARDKCVAQRRPRATADPSVAK